jgi:hypothetical protein
MSVAAALTLFGILALIASGAHMMLRPGFFGGRAAFAGPRTVRQFGIFFVLLGAVALVLTLIKFVSE